MGASIDKSRNELVLEFLRRTDSSPPFSCMNALKPQDVNHPPDQTCESKQKETRGGSLALRYLKANPKINTRYNEVTLSNYLKDSNYPHKLQRRISTLKYR
jgi:hypothetical protein